MLRDVTADQQTSGMTTTLTIDRDQASTKPGNFRLSTIASFLFFLHLFGFELSEPDNHLSFLSWVKNFSPPTIT